MLVYFRVWILESGAPWQSDTFTLLSPSTWSDAIKKEILKMISLSREIWFNLNEKVIKKDLKKWSNLKEVTLLKSLWWTILMTLRALTSEKAILLRRCVFCSTSDLLRKMTFIPWTESLEECLVTPMITEVVTNLSSDLLLYLWPHDQLVYF